MKCWPSLLVLLVLLVGARAAAQDATRLTFHLQPTRRAQLAIWIESAPEPSGVVARFRTVLLTESVGKFGIGNRPGALGMNSGFHWPYGRREGALPVWAHRRVEVAGQAPFRRVIFRNRREGAASQAALRPADPYADYPDPYFCLDFHGTGPATDTLDATTCASTYNSDRGRYIADADLAAGYSEPVTNADGSLGSYVLGATSLYPPRREVVCSGTACPNPDAYHYAADAQAVLPEVDEVSHATFAETEPVEIMVALPGDWPPGHYVAYVEANTEGDYNSTYNARAFPGPPSDMNFPWDGYAHDYGFAYRGQPSVVYRVDFDLPTIDPMMDVATTALPVGHGSVDGRGGADATMYDMSDGTMTLDTPGSGAERLLPLAGDGARVRLEVRSPMYCVGATLPAPITDLAAAPVADEHHSHEWGHLTFSVPAHDPARAIVAYEVRVSTSPITDEASFVAGGSAYAGTIDNIALAVPTDGASGEPVAVDFGHLNPLTHYWVGVRASTDCRTGAIAVAELDTTAIHFTTVSPCFVATAAYGTPMAGEIGALRRFRDRHLRTNAIGRAVVAAYYSRGPELAGVVRANPAVRDAVRAILRPIVGSVRALDD